MEAHFHDFVLTSPHFMRHYGRLIEGNAANRRWAEYFSISFDYVKP